MDNSKEIQTSENSSIPIAYNIEDACKESGKIGTSKLYQDIADGKLIAHKNGRRTVILHENLLAYLRNLPQLGE
jgi:hypothetical protein